MPELFCICTSRVDVYWRGPQPLRGRTRAGDQADERGPRMGTLRIEPRRRGLSLEEGSQRAGVPPELGARLDTVVGPALLEQTSYDVLIRGRDGSRVELRHRDPALTSALASPRDPSILHGTINFQSQVGLSRFGILIDGQPELDFVVEVCPSKINYRDDFDQMVARVQDLATGLALEYLRATYHLGAATGPGETTRLEWITLLRHLLHGLERGVRHIAARPIRGLAREPRLVRIDQVRRSDHQLRQAVRREGGRGSRHRLRSGIPVRSHLPERRAEPTLDTPEHRWLAVQLARTRRRLSDIVQEEEERIRGKRAQPTEGEKQALAELRQLEARVSELEALEPIEAATRPPPAGFSSLQLQGAPGYRESFQALTILQLGLRIGGGPVELSLKDLHLLYEYWCFLETVQLVAELLDHPIPVSSLIEVRSDGLRVRLERGRAQSVRFKLPGLRSLEVTYNPTFHDQDVLLPQQPDVVLAFEDPNWPTVRLVLDAKYRLQEDPDFLDRFGAPGPPPDAVNVLHRYRDAILHTEEFAAREGSGRDEANDGVPAQPSVPVESSDTRRRAVRTVIEGAALFPLDAEASQGFEGSRFWKGLERLGIGALPFLPGSTRYVEAWLRNVLNRSGWSTAGRAIAYEIRERAVDWARAAEEPVLVGVLSGGREAEHLAWIEATATYYAPLTPSQERQMSARWVALYSPSSLRGKGTPGAVTHIARVDQMEIRPRSEIDTPWPGRRGADSLHVVYKLGPLRTLERPVENTGLNGRGGTRFSQNRWTSRLAIECAEEVTELLLESRSEWTMYEALRAEGREFSLRVDRAPGREGRVWFDLADRRIRWAGMKGWEVRRGRRAYFSARPLV